MYYLLGLDCVGGDGAPCTLQLKQEQIIYTFT